MATLVAPEHLDVGFVLACAALVFLMQGGFCLVESGLVRAKNSINVAVKNTLDCCISTMVFFAVGFPIMFGPTYGGLIGTPNASFDWQDGSITAFFLFQLVFCSAASTIVSGAIAERTRLAVYLIVTFVIAAFVYPMVGHWVWGGLLPGTGQGWLARLGYIDWAGGSVVHVVGGCAALAAAIAIGPRRSGVSRSVTTGNNLPLATLGVFVLWFGWWGFNAGSGLSVSPNTASVLLITNLGAVVGGITGSLLCVIYRRRVEIVDMLNGILAGLVSVTAAAHVISPFLAIVIAIVGSFVAVASHEILKELKIDDVVGAFPVHGAAGIWGTIAVGFFALPGGLGTNTRLLQVGVQSLGVLAIALVSFSSVYLTLSVLKRFYRLRVNATQERIGLNMSEHGATTEVLDVLLSMNVHRKSGDYSQRIEVDPHTEAGQIANEYNHVLSRVNNEMESHRQTNEGLKSEQLRLQTVLEHAGVGIYQLDADGKFESANSHALQTLGYRSTDELIRAQGECILPWHCAQSEIADLVRRSVDKGIAVRDIESQLQLPGESAPIWLLESLVPVRSHTGQLLCWLGTVHDVTERKSQLLEQIAVAEARSEAKGTFLASMSHEIRTPLNGVIGMMDLLGNTEIDDQQRHYLKVARSSADSLLSIINDILDFSKIEAGKLDLESVEFDLPEVIESTAEQLAAQAHQKGLELNCELASGLPKFVLGDSERIRQVLVNLIGNAVKFTSHGEINLRATRRGSKVRFAVEDTGIGMSSEVQSRLFQAFMQADASTTRQYGGTGLGLAISNELVRRMGSKISVSSTPEVGTIFSFELELKETRASTAEDKVDVLFAKHRVLVVDDNSTNCEILRDQLQFWGCEVEVCRDPIDVVERLEEAKRDAEPFTLVLLDYCMPELSGKDVALAIRQEPALDDTKIILLSSNHELLSLSELEACGITTALTKPARLNRLYTAVINALTNRDGLTGSLDTPTTATEPLTPPAKNVCEVADPRTPVVADDVADQAHEVEPSVLPQAKVTAAVDSLDYGCVRNANDSPTSDDWLPREFASNIEIACESAAGDDGDSAAQHEPEQEHEPVPRLTANVLVAEDNEVNQLVVSQMLDSLGYSVDIANDGQEAIEKFRSGRYQLILMDGHMPGTDGIEATKSIRAYELSQRAAGRSLPHTAIVALTANVIAGYREDCIQTGMNDYLIKPITLDRLRSITDEYCSRSIDHSPLRDLSEHWLEEVNEPTEESAFSTWRKPYVPAGVNAAPVTRSTFKSFSGAIRAGSDKTQRGADDSSRSAKTPGFCPAGDAEKAKSLQWLDHEALRQRCGGDEELESQILGLMRDALPTRAKEIAMALRLGDPKKAEFAAQRLKGAAADSSLTAVQDAAAKLENLTHRGEIEKANRLLPSLHQRVDETLRLLESLLDRKI